jgi:hypothetical protein
MTIVAVWRETDDALWSVADTRISSPGQGGGTIVRTDTGAKLFALPIVCHRLLPDLTARRAPHYQTTIGYAFAGDVLPATMTYATASTFLQNLATPGEASPPMLREIAELVRSLGEQFSKESLGSSNGKYGRFEAVVFGWCPHLARFAIYHLSPNSNASRFEMDCTENLPNDSSSVIILGSGRTKLLESINSIRLNGDRFGRKGRIPKLAAEAVIEEDVGDVGGSLSIGIANRFGYDLYSWLRPVEPGKPDAFLSFNGIVLDQRTAHVGHYIVAMDGMV